jgi:histidinol-phosphate aminotransferase
MKVQVDGQTKLERARQSLGIKRSKIAKLDLNENFFISRKRLLEIIMEALEDFDPRLYPGEEERELREKISSYLGIPAGSIIIGNGSDELIERIARLFLKCGKQALTISPTFSIYRRVVSLMKAELREVPLKENFSLDVNGLLSKVTSKTKVLFLCSPNNPTANQFEMGDMELLIEKFPGIVVVDEAYVEFADYSAALLIKKYGNLVVLRTFSKAFGLAGLRLGYCIASAEITTVLSRNAALPYPVNTVALKVGTKILENIEIVKKAIKQVKREREKLIGSLNSINGVKAFESKTNFVLFKTEKPSTEAYHGLLKREVIVKNLGSILNFQNCFRATVGLPWMNMKLIRALKEINSPINGG